MNRNFLHAYAVVRCEDDAEGVPVEQRVTVKKVVFDPRYAESEVERLNALNRGKGARYFWHVTRIEQPFAEEAPARANEEPAFAGTRPTPSEV